MRLYDGSLDDIPAMLDPTNHYVAAVSGQDGCVGFCCFGADARVAGGPYPEGPLDIGFGLRPDLLGRGWGTKLLAAALTFGRKTYHPPSFRATVAAFNERSLRTCQRAGFREQDRFTRPADRLEFVLLLRDGAATRPMSPH